MLPVRGTLPIAGLMNTDPGPAFRVVQKRVALSPGLTATGRAQNKTICGVGESTLDRTTRDRGSLIG